MWERESQWEACMRISWPIMGRDIDCMEPACFSVQWVSRRETCELDSFLPQGFYGMAILWVTSDGASSLSDLAHRFPSGICLVLTTPSVKERSYCLSGL